MSETIWFFVALFIGFVIGKVPFCAWKTVVPDREILVKAVVDDFFGTAKWGDVLQHLEDAAWESRMDGGCHSPRSEVLTIWARHLRAILPTEDPKP